MSEDGHSTIQFETMECKPHKYNFKVHIFINKIFHFSAGKTFMLQAIPIVSANSLIGQISHLGLLAMQIVLPCSIFCAKISPSTLGIIF